MSGFVAIVAAHAAVPVRTDDLDELTRAYVDVRGTGSCTEARAGDWAAAVKIDTPAAETEGVERDGGGWALHCGSVVGPRPVREAPVEVLEGVFGLLRYHEADDELELLVDPFGMQTVFVASAGPSMYLSTSALALARHLRAPLDDDAALLFVRAGIQFGAPTHWTGIRRLEPATRIRFRRGSSTEDRYWMAEIDREVRNLSLQAAASRVIDTTIAAWQPLRQGPTAWADLTGGFDSRLLNVTLEAARVPFMPQTRETRRTDDAEIARRVADAAGWEWTLFGLPPEWPEEFPSFVTRAVGWSDGHLDALHLARNLRQHLQAAQRHRSLFVGIGSDHFRGHAWRQEMLREGRSSQVNWDNLLDMRLLHPMDVSLFAADPTATVRDALRHRFVTWTAPYGDELNTVQLDAVQAFKMTGHAGAFCSADAANLRAMLPFYMKPIYTTGFSIDHRHRNQHRLMRHMIHRLNPAVAAVETETGGPAEPWRPDNLHRFVPYYTKLGRKLANKLSYRLAGREIWPVRLPMDDLASRAVARYVESLGLRRNTMRTGHLYSTALDPFLADATAGRFPDLDVLGRIVTVELAVRAAST